MKNTRVSDPNPWEPFTARPCRVAARGRLGDGTSQQESERGRATLMDRPECRAGGVSLIQASLSGDLGEVRRLISMGIDVNFTNQYGVSALMVACLWARKDVVEFLLEQSADTRPVEYAAGSDALLYACLSGNSDIVRLILDGGAAVDAKNRFGRTPLMVAASVGDVDAVRLLVARGADVNAMDNSGTTSLQLAMDQGFEEVAAVLGRGGAYSPLPSDGFRSTSRHRQTQLGEEIL